MDARFLFVTWPGGGNIQPFLCLAARLMERGHTVTVLGTNSTLLARNFESRGIVYHAAPDDEMLQPVLDEVQREPPDVLVVDYMLPDALCAAERTGRPYTSLVHSLSWGIAIAEPSPMQAAAEVPEVNRMRHELGLPPVERVVDLLDHADLVLAAAPPELDRPVGPLARNVRYVGPLLEGPGTDADWRPDCSDEQLVVVSLGTTPFHQRPVIQRLLDAVADLPIRVLVNLGEDLDADDFRAPSNAQLRGYVRHTAVLPHAALVVNHAGLGSIVAALMFGLPMLCLPIGNDQPTNARAVERLGAGLVLPPEAAPEQLRAAISDLLSTPTHRQVAMQVAAALHARRGAKAAVNELEQLASVRQARVWATR
jgi:MGT family glycosyltransferase